MVREYFLGVLIANSLDPKIQSGSIAGYAVYVAPRSGGEKNRAMDPAHSLRGEGIIIPHQKWARMLGQSQRLRALRFDPIMLPVGSKARKSPQF